MACIVGATIFYVKRVITRFGDNFKSVEWQKNNRMKVFWTLSIPLTVLSPAVDELIFRVPLIIAFGAISSVAWYGVFASSGLFALSHWFGKKIRMSEIIYAKENGNHKSDDVVAEINRLHTKEGKIIMARRVLHVVLALPLGILTGYYGIKYQSVWVAFGIHFVWNFVIPVVVPILIFLGALVFFGISSLWDGVVWRRRRSW